MSIHAALKAIGGHHPVYSFVYAHAGVAVMTVHCRQGGAEGTGTIQTACAATEGSCGTPLPGAHPLHQNPQPTEGHTAGSLAHAVLS